MNTLEYQIFYRRHLPHFQPEGATLFVTFRLAGSLPRQTLARWAAEAEIAARALDAITDAKERSRQADIAQRKRFDQWDTELAAALSGPTWLQDERLAGFVADALRFRDGRVYDLLAYCIMPNHVHVVCSPLRKADGSYHAIPAILHSLKSYTAGFANRLLNRHGAFWQHESYDHVVRSEGELKRVIAYVANNPVKAHLVHAWQDWKWTYIKPDYLDG